MKKQQTPEIMITTNTLLLDIVLKLYKKVNNKNILHKGILQDSNIEIQAKYFKLLANSVINKPIIKVTEQHLVYLRNYITNNGYGYFIKK